MSARILVADIQAATARHFHIPISGMVSAQKTRDVVRPRQVAMYIAWQTTGQSLRAIGQRFGNRNHATVMHAVRQIEKLRAVDTEIDDAVTGIMAGLAG